MRLVSGRGKSFISHITHHMLRTQILSGGCDFTMKISRHYYYVIAVILFTSTTILTSCKKTEEATVAQPLEIQVGTVKKGDVPLSKEFTGRTAGSVDAEVRARVEGVLTKQHFQEGSEVTEGQVLYSIDQAPFLAKVAEAKAQLAEAKTKLVQAESDFARIEPLAKIDAVSKRDLDRATSQKGIAQSLVEAATAQVEAANIQLGYTTITAPTSGTIGISKAKVGEVVGSYPNAVILNTVSKLDPIHVQFSVSESDYLYFARLKQQNPTEGKRSLEMVLADNTMYPERGEVVKVDRGVDANSGAIAIEAAFPNTNKLLRPGLFAKVRTVAETRHGALLVSKKAVKEMQGKYFVFIVDGEGKVEQRSITTGPVAGEQQVIEQGVSEGETIALDGIQRLRTGSIVRPKKVES